MTLELIFDEIFIGDLDRRVDVISTTLDDNLCADICNALDLPGQAPAGYELEEHVFGGRVGDNFIFAEIGPDQSSDRPGMVFAHGLAIPINKVGEIESVEPIFTHLSGRRPAKPEAKRQLISFQANQKPHLNRGFLDVLMSSDKGPAVTTSPKVVEEWALTVWPHLFPAMRRSLNFGLAFSPGSRNGERLHFALVPATILAQYPGESKFEKTQPPQVEAKTIAARGLFGDFRNSIDDIVQKIELEDVTFDMFPMLAQASEYLQQPSRSFDETLAALQIFLSFQPNSEKGQSVKTLLVDQLLHHPSFKSLPQLLQLRNVDFVATGEDASKVKTRLITITNDALSSFTTSSNVTSLFTSSLNQRAQKIWTEAIRISLQHPIPAVKSALAVGFKDLIYDDSCDFVACIELLDANEMDKDIADKIASEVRLVSEERAVTLAKHGFLRSEAEALFNKHNKDAISALDACVSRDKTTYKNVAISRCLRSLDDQGRVSAALKLNNSLVTESALSAIIENPALLHRKDLNNQSVLTLWSAALEQDPGCWKILPTIEAVQKEVFAKLLNPEIGEVSPVREKVLCLLMEGPVGNWLKHPSQADAFERLPASALRPALSQTAKAWIRQYPTMVSADSRLAPSPILGHAINAPAFSEEVGKVLLQNTPIVGLEAFSGNTSLTEGQFAKFVRNVIEGERHISLNLSEKIGRLLVSRRWQGLTRQLAKDFRHRTDLKPGFAVAANHLGLFDNLLMGLRQISDKEVRTEFANLLAELYPSGLDDRNVIERAEGSLENFDLSGSGKQMWQSAIFRIHSGARPTFREIVSVSLQDYPMNDKLKYFETKFKV